MPAKTCARHPRYPGVYTYPLRGGETCFYIRYSTGPGTSRKEKVGRSTDGYTAKDAAAVRAERIRAIRHGEELPDPRSRLVTLEGIWPEYRRYLEIHHPASLKGMESTWRLYLQPFGRMPIRSLKRADVSRAMEAWRRDFKASTVNGILRKLQSMINWAIKEGLYQGSNPIAGMKYLQTNDHRDRWLTKKEARQLLATIRKYQPDAYMFALISLMTGARKGEVIQIDTANIDWAAEVCFIPKAKGHQGGRYLFLGGCIDKLHQYMLDQDIKGPLFRGLSADTLTRVFTRAVQDCGFNAGVTDTRRRVVFHTLRHTCASWLVQAGTDILTVSRILGHKSIHHTMRYAHLAPDQQHEAVRALGRALGRDLE